MNFTRNILATGKCILTFGVVGKKEVCFVGAAIKFYATKTPPISSGILGKEFIKHEIPKKFVHETVPVMQQIKKRTVRILRDEEEDLHAEGYFQVTAYATAEEYNLETLLAGIQKQDIYEMQNFFSTDALGAEQDVLYVTAKNSSENEEPRDIFFFREGSVVMWNCSEIETRNLLKFLRYFERDRYQEVLVQGEKETMPYKHINDGNGPRIRGSKFYLSHDQDNFLEKYTFSNALASSIKLGIWEAKLDMYIDSMEFITEDLKRGSKIRISRAELLRKTGELFALRHLINLSSDLLDTPDFYWDREHLETLYSQVCTYFSISRRTKVVNEKINHCIELAELVSSNLNDIHHVRLEWMIIILIMVEVGFEVIHYAERYLANSGGNEVELSPVVH